MAGVKGRSGTNRNKDKHFADMIRLAVNEVHQGSGLKKLRIIADRVADLAMAGESWAAQMIADRLDGKPAQESTVTIDDRREVTEYSDSELIEILRSSRDMQANKDAVH